jgi:plastocyanin
MFFTAALLLSVPVFALASPQYGYGGGDSSSSSSAAPASSATTAASAAAPSAPANTPGHFNVDVAFQNTLTFNPANLTVSNGSTVTFFFPTAITHSVTQSSFAAPCTYLAATSDTSGGFDSGLTAAKQFTITVTDDTKPIWFHCKMAKHCGQGMVGSINAPSTGNTFEAFKAAALKIGGSQTPETATGFVSGGVNAQATASPAATAASASPSKNSALRFKVGAGAGLFAVALALGSA